VLGRFGQASIPPPATLLQQDDVVHVVVASDNAAALDSALHFTGETH